MSSFVNGLQDVTGLNSKDVQLSNKFSDLINDAIKGLNLSVTMNEVLTIIKNESSYRGLTENNEDIIGDKNLVNKAYGVMQVRKPALLDVNSNFNLNYSEEHLKLLHVNIIVGSAYLDLCKKQAEKETISVKDRTFLMYKKYNGGIGITLSRKNSSDNYASLSLTNLNVFSKIG